MRISRKKFRTFFEIFVSRPIYMGESCGPLDKPFVFFKREGHFQNQPFLSSPIASKDCVTSLKSVYVVGYFGGRHFELYLAARQCLLRFSITYGL